MRHASSAISRAVASPPATFRFAAPHTAAPSQANWSAVAFPMPDDEPVTIATLPPNRSLMR